MIRTKVGRWFSVVCKWRNETILTDLKIIIDIISLILKLFWIRKVFWIALKLLIWLMAFRTLLISKKAVKIKKSNLLDYFVKIWVLSLLLMLSILFCQLLFRWKMKLSGLFYPLASLGNKIKSLKFHFPTQ